MFAILGGARLGVTDVANVDHDPELPFTDDRFRAMKIANFPTNEHWRQRAVRNLIPRTTRLPDIRRAHFGTLFGKLSWLGPQRSREPVCIAIANVESLAQL